MLEIYNDQLRDLLVDVRRANDLKLVDGVVNTRSVEVHNTMDVLKVGARGL
jgi:3-deoxy-D-arabino-heptulosonate 7-phosphate (DAHP) synthase